jgi:hypothetical protein
MITELIKPEEISVFRRFAPMIGLLAAWGFGLWAAPAHAQVNIDQGKSAAEIFSNDCGTCHKGAKGLANGKNSATLASFLREHYTSSAQQAASLAAYVLGAGAGPPPSASLKPGTGEPKTGEVRIGEPKAGEKPGTHPGRPEAPATAKLQPPGREPRPVTASRGPRQEPETPPPAPQAAPVVTPEAVPAPVATTPATEPSNSEAPAAAAPPPAMPATAAAPTAVPEPGPAPSAAMSAPEGSPSAVEPAETPPSDGAPVPRDDIPD